MKRERTHREKYYEEFGRQIVHLGDLLLARSSHTLDTMRQVYLTAHKIKGSAPIFGFDQAGQIAKKLAELWEWTTDQGTTALTDTELAANVETSHRLLIQLKIEHEIFAKRLQFEGQDGDDDSVHIAAQEKRRLLLIDDDDALRSYLVSQLTEDGYHVTDVADLPSAKQVLRKDNFDLIILDLMMYPESGYLLFDYLKEDPTLKWIPLIVLSGREDVQDKVQCLRSGADDYVTKPFQYMELEARINNLLNRAKQFELLAFRDGLTGLFNRRYFDHQLKVELNWAKRDQTPVSLAFLDIDHFKKVNDTHGHHIGDYVLQGIGPRIQRNLRSTDLLARYGGEEIVVLLPDTDEERAVALIERILEDVRREAILSYQGQDLFITVSAGVAQWSEGMTIGEWVKTADMAMYKAKEQGRDRVAASSGILTY